MISVYTSAIRPGFDEIFIWSSGYVISNRIGFYPNGITVSPYKNSKQRAWWYQIIEFFDFNSTVPGKNPYPILKNYFILITNSNLYGVFSIKTHTIGYGEFKL